MFSSMIFASAKGVPPTPVLAVYMVFFLGACAVYHLVAQGEFSSILTISVMLQTLAIALLVLQVLSTGSASGISVRALALDACAFTMRLSSTTWLNGYLPVDASGDMVYQAMDIISLLLVLGLIHRICTTLRCSYQESHDTFPCFPLIVGSIVLAALFHADMNDRPIFDTLWMSALFVSVVDVLPQLWLSTQTGGKMEALTSHYIAVMAVSRILSGVFMWHARFDITCAFWIDGFNHASLIILIAHGVHMLLLADFAFIYIKALMKQGLGCRLDLNESIAHMV
mmetsp:Transcript_69561/g.166838  ORF Transcript_69561/g.166838 Transcript_69561/m.166838 type:complete len:283 (-) Transcript_69561:275-1123(-)